MTTSDVDMVIAKINHALSIVHHPHAVYPMGSLYLHGEMVTLRQDLTDGLMKLLPHATP